VLFATAENATKHAEYNDRPFTGQPDIQSYGRIGA